jgi:tetratricopeptide (TPR) repeat protein
MDFAVSTIAALFVAMGLVATDALINANSLFLDVDVAPALQKRGYSEKVVHDGMIEEMKTIASRRSLVAAPQIYSSSGKSISVALADIVNLGRIMKDAQALVGYAPPKMHVTIVEDEGDFILEASGVSERIGQIVVTGRLGQGTTDEMIRQAARDLLRRMEPYIVILDAFDDVIDDGKGLERIEEEIAREIASLPPTPLSQKRANFENLLGIVDLHLNKITDAEVHFRNAIEAAPDFGVAYLNLAFVHVQNDDYQSAIDIVSEWIDPWYWPKLKSPVLRAAGHVIRGVGHWGLEHYDEALAEFAYATRLHPQSTETYVYWGRLLHELDREEEANEKFLVARQNLAHFESFPEVALLYFWLTERDQEPLQRRGHEFMALQFAR